MNKTVVRVLHGTCEALGGRKRNPWLLASFRDFELPRATDLGQGPHLHRSVHAGLLRAPQPRPREKTHGRKSKKCHCTKKVSLVHSTRFPFGMWVM